MYSSNMLSKASYYELWNSYLSIHLHKQANNYEGIYAAIKTIPKVHTKCSIRHIIIGVNENKIFNKNGKFTLIKKIENIFAI